MKVEHFRYLESAIRSDTRGRSGYNGKYKSGLAKAVRDSGVLWRLRSDETG